MQAVPTFPLQDLSSMHAAKMLSLRFIAGLRGGGPLWQEHWQAPPSCSLGESHTHAACGTAPHVHASCSCSSARMPACPPLVPTSQHSSLTGLIMRAVHGAQGDGSQGSA